MQSAALVCTTCSRPVPLPNLQDLLMKQWQHSTEDPFSAKLHIPRTPMAFSEAPRCERYESGRTQPHLRKQKGHGCARHLSLVILAITGDSPKPEARDRDQKRSSLWRMILLCLLSFTELARYLKFLKASSLRLLAFQLLARAYSPKARGHPSS